MKFTPSQVIEMAREAKAVPTSKDYAGGAAGWFLLPDDLTRLCTLAADRALEAQAARIAELEADYQRLMDKHNALHVNALKERTERDTLRAEVERQTSALKVIYTWAGIPGALKPENVRELSGKALGKATQ